LGQEVARKESVAVRVIPEIPDLAFKGSNLFDMLTFAETTVLAPKRLRSSV